MKVKQPRRWKKHTVQKQGEISNRFSGIVRQTADQVGDDPIAILHHRCGDLDIAAPQRQKLHRIPPGLNAAHAADGNAVQLRTDRHIINMAQCNGFHRLAGIAADCGFSHHARNTTL